MYVLRRPPDAPDLPAVVGFYTLSMCSLERDEVPDAQRKRLPAYPMPVALIGRFATDGRVQRQGFGEVLLRDALARIAASAQLIACFGVIADAKNERAEAFYARRGFARTKPDPAGFPRRMFLPATAIKSG